MEPEKGLSQGVELIKLKHPLGEWEKQLTSMSLGHARVLEVLIPWEEQTLPAAARGTLQPHVNHVSGQLFGSHKSSCSSLGSLVAVVLCYRFD